MTELIDLVRVDTADVYKQGTLAGQLRRGESYVDFRYDEDYLASNGQPVATTLPLSADPVRTAARSVPPYFAGLLPEGRRLSALRQALKTSADDDFSMLLAVGSDPVGDVQVVVAGEPCPAFGAAAGNADSLAVAAGSLSFAELLADATGLAPDRVGIAGVQDKVSGRMVSLPLRQDGGPGSILKFDPPESPHLVRNEAFFLTMAAACGVDTVRWRVVVDRGGNDGLLLTRFDRALQPDGSVCAFAAEDGCQLSNRYPGDKYGLSTEAVFSTMAARCASPRVAALRMFRQFLFALITGNGDLHAKNLSLMFSSGEWLPSPAYDLPSSAPYGDYTLAMAVQGRREGQVSHRRAAALGASVGLPPVAVASAIEEMTTKCLPWADRLDELPFDQRRRRQLATLIRRRCALLTTGG